MDQIKIGKFIVLGIILSVAVGLCACKANTENGQENLKLSENTEECTYAEEPMEKEGYTLVWNDEFDGDALDLTKWSYQIGNGSAYGLNNWGNAEQQYYTDRKENVSVSDGILTITAQKEEQHYENYSFTSG